MAYRTPTQIGNFLAANMHKMDNPVQFMGDEPNSYRKPWDSAEVRSCIYACWSYEQAAGNQSIPQVYRAMNDVGPEFLCDRTYFPSTPRDLRMFDRNGIPVFGVESRHQLRDFDVIGTSISYPVLTVNLVKQLMMSDIPPQWENRHKDAEKWPFVIVGGQCYGAPEVVANIVDAVFVGEIEDEAGNPGIAAVLRRVQAMKRAGLWATDRMECYRQLALEFNFLYFPCFVDVHYAYEDRESVRALAAQMGVEEVYPSKQVIGFSSNLPGMRMPFVKRFVHDMDSIVAMAAPPLLYTDPGMGVGDAEVGRGCPAWCSFCALTYRQKPYRQRSVGYMVDFTQELMRNTGSIHTAPFSPDFPMHTQKKKLIAALLENVTDEVDASSMRVDDFIEDPSYILLQAHGGMDTVTLGVEGNSQRMRDLVGKGAADEDIREAVARGIRAGIKKFKLYMIGALPGEDAGDIYKIMELAKDVADIRDSMGSQARIQFSWTPMLIEGNTPFQWFAPTTSNYALGDAWEELRTLRIDFKLGGKAQKDKRAYFQLTQRASRDVGRAMVEAVMQMNVGCWGGAPRGLYEVVEERLKANGFLNGYLDCFDERTKQDMFGWEMVDQGINVDLLWVTYRQMVEFLENTDSWTYDDTRDEDYHGSEWIEKCDDRCMGNTCGVCNKDDLKLRQTYIQAKSDELSVDLSTIKVIDQKTLAMKVRAKVFKDIEHRFVMNDHFKYALRRAAYRADVPITKRTVVFATDNLKYKDWTCGTDYVEFGLTKRLSKAQITDAVARMNDELSSMQIIDWTVLPASADPLRTDVDVSLYDMEIDVDVQAARAAVQRWDEAEYVKMVLHEDLYGAGMQRDEVNGKDYVDDLWLVLDGHRLSLRMLVRGKANPYVVYAALFGKSSWIEAAKYPAVRLDSFVESDGAVIDSFRPVCEWCGQTISTNLIDKPYSVEQCPKCADEHAGVMVGSLVRSE